MKENIIVVKWEDKLYPEQLKDIENPPQQLFCIGRVELLRKKSLAVVGSRKCTEYGKRTAMKIGEAATENGLAVISGMAKGIDNFAHLGALKGNGDTIAVLGCGADVCYPAENKRLYDEICQRGLIVSEYPPETKPMPYMFPQRNRIISGLSEAVTVVEAGTNSGALITAEYGAVQSKEVFAVPGNITSHCSLGTNKLLVEGARPIAVIDDIFLGMGIEPRQSEEKMPELGEDEKQVYEIVKSRGEVQIDEIAGALNKDIVRINGLVSVLEMKGMIAYSFGKVFTVK